MNKVESEKLTNLQGIFNNIRGNKVMALLITIIALLEVSLIFKLPLFTVVAVLVMFITVPVMISEAIQDCKITRRTERVKTDSDKQKGTLDSIMYHSSADEHAT